MSQTTARNRSELQAIVDPLVHTKVSFSESQKLYEDWREQGTYDTYITNPDNYQAPFVLKRAAVKYFKDPRNQLILDLGAGTGISGEALYECGFRKLHALEPLKGFADDAQKKGVYSKIFIENIGFDKTVSAANGWVVKFEVCLWADILSVPFQSPDIYDGVVSVGAFGPGHIPCNALYEIVRITKPGGHVIICMREEYIRTAPDYRDKLEPLMKRLEEEGKWRMILREVYPNHFTGYDGLLYVFQVC